MAAPDPRDPLRRILGLQTSLISQLAKLLGSVLADSDAQLKRNLKPGKAGEIRRAQIRNAKRANASVQGGLFKQLGDLIKGAASDAVAEATKAGALYDGEYLETLGMSSSEAKEYHKSLEQSARRSVEAAINRNLDQTGTTKRKLSDRVYGTLNLSNGLVDRRIESGIARGLSAKELADEVRDLISPEVKGGVSYAAQRLARTELNNAFHYQQIKDAQGKPWITGMQWQLSKSHPEKDICDTIAAGGSAGKGKGIYTLDAVPPKPHPQCLCYLTPVTMEPEEFEERFLNGEFDDLPSAAKEPPKQKIEGKFDIGDEVRNSFGDKGKVVKVEEVNGKTWVDVDYGDGYPIGVPASELKHKDGAAKAPKAAPKPKSKSAPKPAPKATEPAKPGVKPVAEPPRVDRSAVEKRLDKLTKVPGSRASRLPGEYRDMQEEHRDNQDGWRDGLDDDEWGNVKRTVVDSSKGPVRMRLSESTLGKILDSGEFKNAHVSGSTSAPTELDADEYKELREAYEREFMNGEDTPIDQLPVYGYVGEPGDVIDTYGRIDIEFKPSVRKRTTATVGDSLAGFPQPYPLESFPSLTNRQILASVAFDEIDSDSIRSGRGFNGYMEAQIHGVDVSDIESVTFPSSERGSPLVARLRAAGIKVKFR